MGFFCEMVILVIFKGFLSVKNLENFDPNCPRSLYIFLLCPLTNSLTPFDNSQCCAH